MPLFSRSKQRCLNWMHRPGRPRVLETHHQQVPLALQCLVFPTGPPTHKEVNTIPSSRANSHPPGGLRAGCRCAALSSIRPQPNTMALALKFKTVQGKQFELSFGEDTKVGPRHCAGRLGRRVRSPNTRWGGRAQPPAQVTTAGGLLQGRTRRLWRQLLTRHPPPHVRPSACSPAAGGRRQGQDSGDPGRRLPRRQHEHHLPGQGAAGWQAGGQAGHSRRQPASGCCF